MPPKEDNALSTTCTTKRVAILRSVALFLTLTPGTLGIAVEPSKRADDTDITTDQVEREQPAKSEPATLEDLRKAEAGTYSEIYVIHFMGRIGSLGTSNRKMPREKAGMRLHEYLSIRFFVKNLVENAYMRHGTNSKLAEGEEPVPDRGIPRDADPHAIIIFPPANPGASEVVRQYKLRERC